MTTTRRSILRGGGATLATLALGPARAQESASAFPSHEIRVICAFPAGSGADVFVRFFADKMKPFLGNPTMIVENKAGANGNLAATQVARAKPDGYTFMIHAPSAVAANMHLFKNPGFDAATAFETIGAVSLLPFSVSVAKDSPYKTLRELIVAMKAKGDKASFATTAPTGQVAGAMLKTYMGLKAVEIPYRTGPDSLNDLISGNLDYALLDPIFALAQERAGKIRVIALSSKERMKAAPSIPTFQEEGVPNVDVVSWWGALAPKGVPTPILDKLGAAFASMAALPETRDFLAKFGSDPLLLSRADAHRRFLADIVAWGDYVKLAKIEPKG